MPDNILTKQVGPLPLVAWVALGSGGVFLLILLTHKSSGGNQPTQTNSVTALAPTEAEAFGTMEQQQQDVVNALTTLGNNQSAMGGSLQTLTGMTQQYGTSLTSQMSNLQTGMDTANQGIASGNTAATSYYQSLLSNLQNYYNSLYGQGNTLSGQVAGVSGQVSGVQQGVNGISQGVDSLSSQVRQGNALTQSQINQLGSFMGWEFYQLPNRYSPYILPGVNPPGWS